jgi:predicted nucleic acid-binding protein
MIVLLDTDILIDVAIARKPFAEYSAKVLDYAETRQVQACIAWHSIANFFYLVSAKSNSKLTRRFLNELLKFVEVAKTTTADANYALSLRVNDLEDALQISAAKACGAEVILTRNIRHYKNSPITAQTPEKFLKVTF